MSIVELVKSGCSVAVLFCFVKGKTLQNCGFLHKVYLTLKLLDFRQQKSPLHKAEGAILPEF